MIGLIDDNVGRVMEVLEAQGLVDNTIVVFLSDHGDMLGDHWMLNKGPFHFEGLLHVPMVWSWPGHLPQGVSPVG
jgi:arylsulfatase A-like enzyme